MGDVCKLLLFSKWWGEVVGWAFWNGFFSFVSKC